MINGSTVPDTHTVLPDEVHDQLWERIFVRLDRGDSLITTQDYQLAIESEYLAVTGSDPTETLKELFRQAIQTSNTEHPDRLVARGVQNSVTRGSAAELREVRRQAEVAAEEAQQQIDQLQKDVKTREHTIEGLKEDQEGLETRLETAIKAQAESSGEDAAAEAAERFKENQELRKDLPANTPSKDSSGSWSSSRRISAGHGISWWLRYRNSRN